jgi:hypothetical protein
VLAGRSATRGAVVVEAYVEVCVNYCAHFYEECILSYFYNLNYMCIFHQKVDGTPIDPVAFRKNVAYVMQDDALVQTATPREALAFSAALRLNVSQEEQVK